MRLSGISNPIAVFDPFSTTNSDTTAAEQADLGALIVLGDGRTFRHGKAGGSNVSAGKLQLAPAPKTNHHNCAVTATALGATVVNVTLGATATVADEYDEGFLIVNAGPGVGATYRISYNPVIALSTAGNITLSDPITTTAFTTSTKVNLVHNTWNAFVEAAVQTRRAAGVPLTAINASNYGWVQTRGAASVLADQTIALGSLIAPSASVAGSVIEVSDTFATTKVTNVLGQALIMAGVNQEYRPMWLHID